MDLVKNMLHPVAAERFAAEQIKAHPWIVHKTQNPPSNTRLARYDGSTVVNPYPNDR